MPEQRMIPSRTYVEIAPGVRVWHSQARALELTVSTADPAPAPEIPVHLCDHGYAICAPCGFIPPSWRPQL